MSQLLLYGLKKCSTCLKAQAWLNTQGINHAFIDYRDQKISPDTLKAWAQQLGGWEKLVNRASMTWRALPEETRQTVSSDAQWQALIAEYPALVRRPVMVTAAGKVHVGFSEKRYAEYLA